jgi:hypothetical protein
MLLALEAFHALGFGFFFRNSLGHNFPSSDKVGFAFRNRTPAAAKAESRALGKP